MFFFFFLHCFHFNLDIKLGAKLDFEAAKGLWDWICRCVHGCSSKLQLKGSELNSENLHNTPPLPKEATDTNCQLQCARMRRWWCRLPWQSSRCGRPFGWHRSSCDGWTSRRRPASGRRGHLAWGSALWSPLGCVFCRTGRSPPAHLPGGCHPAQRVSFPSRLSGPASPLQPIVETTGRWG